MSTPDETPEAKSNRLMTHMYRMSKIMVLVQAALSEQAGQHEAYEYYCGLDDSLNMVVQIMEAVGRMDHAVAPPEFWERDCISEALNLMDAVDEVYAEADLLHALD